MTEHLHDADHEGTFEQQRERVDHPMRRLFREYGRPNWAPLSVGLLASAAAFSLRLVPAVVLGVAVDAVFLGQRAYHLPLVPDAWIPAGRVAQFWLSAGLVGGSFLLAAAFAWANGWGLNVFAQRVQHAVRTDTYDAMQRLDLAFFADKQTGELMSVLNNDVNRLEQFLNGGLFMAAMLSVTVGGTAAVLVYLNPELALVAMSVVPIIASFTHRFVQTIQPMYADVRSTVGRLNSRLENNLGGIEVIKAAATEDFESERVDDASREYFDTNYEAITTRIRFFPGLQLTAGLGFVLTFVVGGVWVLYGPPLFFGGALSVGDFVTFVILGQRVIWPMSNFGQLINMYQQAGASAERVFGLLEEPAAIEVAEDAPALEVTEGRVEYHGVTFGYDDPDASDAGASEPVLEDVSFAVEGGDTLALVGPTGAGKSTALKLLLRLYDVDGGRVTVDGQDVREVTPESLRTAIGYVGQETFLFYGTIEENIRYGSVDAGREEVIEAAKRAQAHGFITDLEEGYDTQVGERGVKLSGGQRQRIGIARVLLGDPEVLVLDEATSDVDTETERAIQRGIEAVVEDRTVLAIAHRLSTIRDADEIVVLEDGRVTERGTHEELLEAGGTYADLWGVQAGRLSAPESSAAAE